MSRLKLNARKPPLSKLDRFLYILIGSCALISCFALILFLDFKFPALVAAGQDEKAIATSALHWGFLFPAPTLLTGSIWVAACDLMGRKQPIFGNKSYKPKGFQPLLPVYPLFSKAFRESLSKKSKDKIKLILLILLAVGTVFTALFPLGIFPRKTLDRDNRFCTYNTLNEVVHQERVENAEKLTIEIEHFHRRKGRDRYNISLTFQFKDRSYSFLDNEFFGMSDLETLEHMLYLKSLFKEGEYEILHTERMTNLLERQNYSSKERALVYQLFEYNS